MPRHAVLAGATGLIGSRLLNLLLADAHYERVTVLSRRAIALQHPRLTVHITDFGDLAALGPALRADDVFCALGTTLAKAGSREAFMQVDRDLVVALATAAHRAGSRQFLLVSAIGSDVGSVSFYSRVKGQTEAALRVVGYASLHILRPSLLLGDRQESRPMEQLAQTLAPLLSKLARGPLTRYRPVSADEVAHALLACALREQRGVHLHQAPFA